MKIGIFGGAFNPIHNGHLNLAQCYKKSLSLDKVIFIPTAVPPHKTSEHLVMAEDRINMLKLAISNDSSYDYSDLEFKRNGKSYTYDTLCELKELYKDASLYLIIGSDQYLYFKSWYRYDDILKMATVVTASREENEHKKLLDFKENNPEMKDTMVSSFNVVEVSSSQIRQMVKNGDSICDLVPASVAEYIEEHRLYVE